MEDLMNDHLIKKEKGDIFEMKYKDIVIGEYTSSNLQTFKFLKQKNYKIINSNGKLSRN